MARSGECGGGWRVAGIWQVVTVVAGGQHEVLTVFRRCASLEKIRIDRSAGSNSGEIGLDWLVTERFFGFYNIGDCG